jgi:hypothetical protein
MVAQALGPIDFTRQQVAALARHALAETQVALGQAAFAAAWQKGVEGAQDVLTPVRVGVGHAVERYSLQPE